MLCRTIFYMFAWFEWIGTCVCVRDTRYLHLDAWPCGSPFLSSLVEAKWAGWKFYLRSTSFKWLNKLWFRAKRAKMQLMCTLHICTNIQQPMTIVICVRVKYKLSKTIVGRLAGHFLLHEHSIQFNTANKLKWVQTLASPCFDRWSSFFLCSDGVCLCLPRQFLFSLLDLLFRNVDWASSCVHANKYKWSFVIVSECVFVWIIVWVCGMQNLS